MGRDFTLMEARVEIVKERKRGRKTERRKEKEPTISFARQEAN